MDTFTRSWDFCNNWVCPPPHLVPRTLKHMRSRCPQGTLIVPLWGSAPFWPILTTGGSHLAHFFDDWVDLPPLKTTFCMGRHSFGVFGRENLNFRVLAVPINFRSLRFLLLVFALAIMVGTLSVHLLSLISASGWLMQTPLGLCVLASGWFTQILLALFVLCYSQWMACA